MGFPDWALPSRRVYATNISMQGRSNTNQPSFNGDFDFTAEVIIDPGGNFTIGGGMGSLGGSNWVTNFTNNATFTYVLI